MREEHCPVEGGGAVWRREVCLLPSPSPFVNAPKETFRKKVFPPWGGVIPPRDAPASFDVPSRVEQRLEGVYVGARESRTAIPP